MADLSELLTFGGCVIMVTRANDGGLGVGKGMRGVKLVVELKCWVVQKFPFAGHAIETRILYYKINYLVLWRFR